MDGFICKHKKLVRNWMLVSCCSTRSCDSFICIFVLVQFSIVALLSMVSLSKLQVASFLYHQEKMCVLVEPDVHDIFARIPGFGFVQTFYSQDTRCGTRI